MDIRTEQDITSAAARFLREKAGQSQKAFWAKIGITQSGGCRYESGANIPRPVRTLIFLNHVANIEIDASSEIGAQALIRLGKLQASERANEKEVIGDHMQKAMKHIRQAKASLDEVQA